MGEDKLERRANAALKAEHGVDCVEAKGARELGESGREQAARCAEKIASKDDGGSGGATTQSFSEKGSAGGCGVGERAECSSSALLPRRGGSHGVDGGGGAAGA